MAEWLYCATDETANIANTVGSLARAFLCRTAYRPVNKLGISQLIANVRLVQFGDVIHVAFAWQNGNSTAYSALGTFEILDTPHADHDNYISRATYGQLTLFVVRTESPLETWLGGTTYSRDPNLHVYNGWHVK